MVSRRHVTTRKHGGGRRPLTGFRFPQPGVANYVKALADWQSAQNALSSAQAVKKLSAVENFEKNLATTSQLRTAISAANTAKALGGLRCALGVLGGVAFLASIAAAFLPSQPDPAIMASLQTIQVVTNETLARVKDVQVSLAAVSQELGRLETQIEGLSCASVTDKVKVHVKNIKSFWQQYYGDPDASSVQPTKGSLVGQIVGALGPNPRFPAISVDPTLQALVDKWADQVVDPAVGIMPNVIGIYENLDNQGGTGLIQRCGQYYADMVKMAGPLPFDDRLYYQPLMQLVAVS